MRPLHIILNILYYKLFSCSHSARIKYNSAPVIIMNINFPLLGNELNFSHIHYEMKYVYTNYSWTLFIYCTYLTYNLRGPYIFHITLTQHCRLFITHQVNWFLFRNIFSLAQFNSTGMSEMICKIIQKIDIY